MERTPSPLDQVVTDLNSSSDAFPYGNLSQRTFQSESSSPPTHVIQTKQQQKNEVTTHTIPTTTVINQLPGPREKRESEPVLTYDPSINPVATGTVRKRKPLVYRPPTVNETNPQLRVYKIPSTSSSSYNSSFCSSTSERYSPSSRMSRQVRKQIKEVSTPSVSSPSVSPDRISNPSDTDNTNTTTTNHTNYRKTLPSSSSSLSSVSSSTTFSSQRSHHRSTKPLEQRRYRDENDDEDEEDTEEKETYEAADEDDDVEPEDMDTINNYSSYSSSSSVWEQPNHNHSSSSSTSRLRTRYSQVQRATKLHSSSSLTTVVPLRNSSSGTLRRESFSGFIFRVFCFLFFLPSLLLYLWFNYLIYTHTSFSLFGIVFSTRSSSTDNLLPKYSPPVARAIPVFDYSGTGSIQTTQQSESNPNIMDSSIPSTSSSISTVLPNPSVSHENIPQPSSASSKPKVLKKTKVKYSGSGYTTIDPRELVEEGMVNENEVPSGSKDTSLPSSSFSSTTYTAPFETLLTEYNSLFTDDKEWLPNNSPVYEFSQLLFNHMYPQEIYYDKLLTVNYGISGSSLSPNLPRSSLSYPFWGAAHVPLPPSWVLIQATAAGITNHRKADQLMCSDGQGNSYPLHELLVDDLSELTPSYHYVQPIKHHNRNTNGYSYEYQQQPNPRFTPEESLHSLSSSTVPETVNDDSTSSPASSSSVSSVQFSSFILPPLSHISGTLRMFPRESIRVDTFRQSSVKEAMMHAWRGYRTFAWGFDTLKPVTRSGVNDFGGLCVTMIDSLDTLLIMGMYAEYKEAVNYIVDHVYLDQQEDVNLFELTIRVLGGLLSAYELDNQMDYRLLNKTIHIADSLLFAFDSPTGIPYGTLGMKSRRKYNPAWVPGSTIAEVGTLALEWEHLTYLTGNPKYALAARRALSHLLTIEVPTDSLWPTFVHPDTGEWVSSGVTLGARADSLYEYILKIYCLAGGMRDTRVWAAEVDEVEVEKNDDTISRSNNATPKKSRTKNIHFPGLVGNKGLLFPSANLSLSSVKIQDYAPVSTFPNTGGGTSKGAKAWRASSVISSDDRNGANDGGTPPYSMLNQDRWTYVPPSSSPLTLTYGDTIAEYELRTQFLLQNSFTIQQTDDELTFPKNFQNIQSTVTDNLLSQYPYDARVTILPPFHPVAYLLGGGSSDLSHPAASSSTSSSVTYASEISWYTNLFGAHLRSIAGIEHQLTRISSTIYIHSNNNGNTVASSGSTTGGLGNGRYTYLTERNGEAIVREVTTTVNNNNNPNTMEGVTGSTTTDSTPVPPSSPSSTVTAALPTFNYDNKVDHLVCFVPGYYALSSTVAPTEGLRLRYLALARRLMRTCIRMYTATITGLAPEISRLPEGSDGPLPDQNSKHSLLRPEAVESLFVLYRITGDNIYREWGWQIFGALQTHARIPTGGYSSIKDVTVQPVVHNDHMESFFLAETLKYLYLLFSDGHTIPLEDYVFNTEAHPLPVWKPQQHPGTRR